MSDAIFREHRLCGTPNGYDGCYAHFPMPHCRADGTAWPCDVDSLRGIANNVLDDVQSRLNEWRQDPWNPKYGKAGFSGVIESVRRDLGVNE